MMLKRRPTAKVLIIATSLLQGCAVLTASQVEAVSRFSKATAAYNELPGTLVRSYAVLLRDNALLSIADTELVSELCSCDPSEECQLDLTGATKAWEALLSAYADEQALDEKGRQMDAALAVLSNYSDLLSLLSSDRFTDDLNESAALLGGAIDSAGAKYSEQYRPDRPLSNAGGSIAQLIRSAGGIYIRAKQAQILKQTIASADPAVQELLLDVQRIATGVLKPAIENYERNYLQQEFRFDAIRARRMPITSVEAIYDQLKRAKAAASLADSASQAAKSYAAAHTDLLKQTRSRRTFLGVAAEMRALQNEIKAGQAVKRQVEE